MEGGGRGREAVAKNIDNMGLTPAGITAPAKLKPEHNPIPN
jgi:hypothetical protein